MKLSEVKKLHNGDEVYWHDPDEDRCSRYLSIRSITCYAGGVVVIEETSGAVVECFARELS